MVFNPGRWLISSTAGSVFFCVSYLSPLPSPFPLFCARHAAVICPGSGSGSGCVGERTGSKSSRACGDGEAAFGLQQGTGGTSYCCCALVGNVPLLLFLPLPPQQRRAHRAQGRCAGCVQVYPQRHAEGARCRVLSPVSPILHRCQGPLSGLGCIVHSI